MKKLLILQLALSIGCAVLVFIGHALAFPAAVCLVLLSLLILILALFSSAGKGIAGEAHAADVLMAARRHKMK